MQRANGEGDGDALALELVPNVGANGVVDLVDSGMVAHVELDLVDHGEIGEIYQENFYLRLSQNSVSRGGRSEKGILHAIGWILILNSDANPHRMDLRWIMEIDDGVANHLVVRDIEINGVIRAQPRRAPVNLHYFGKALAHLQPVADLVGPIQLDRYAGDNPGKKTLPGKSEDNRDNPRAGEHSLQLCFGVIPDTQNQKKRD